MSTSVSDFNLSEFNSYMKYSSKQVLRVKEFITGVYIIDDALYYAVSEEFVEYFTELPQHDKSDLIKAFIGRYLFGDTKDQFEYGLNANVVVETCNNGVVDLNFVFKLHDNSHCYDIRTFRDIAKRTFGWYRVKEVDSLFEIYKNSVISFKEEEKLMLLLTNKYKNIRKDDFDV